MTAQFPAPKTIKAGNVNLATYEVDGDPARKRPPIVLVHGWPEIAYCWRNQIHALGDAGFRTIAFDLKGFGRSDAPKDPALYDVEHLTNDFAALLDAFEIERAIFCGHDWGGSLIWSMGQWRPERVAGLIGVCTPLRPRPPAPPVEILKKRFGDKHYFVQFQTPGIEKIFKRDVDRFVQMMFRKPASKDRWPALIPGIFDLPGRFLSDMPAHKDDLIVSDDVLEAYADAYRNSGFHGGVNLYRNVDQNWRLMKGRDETIKAPSLWIGAELDLFLPPDQIEGMDALIPDLEKTVINDTGHWVMWEQPEALNNTMVEWLLRKI